MVVHHVLDLPGPVDDDAFQMLHEVLNKFMIKLGLFYVGGDADNTPQKRTVGRVEIRTPSYYFKQYFGVVQGKRKITVSLTASSTKKNKGLKR